MNINEEMGQLGQIGSTGYSPTDAVVDQLVSRTRRTRAIRRGTAALAGSVGAIGLGLLGAQVFVGLTHDDSDAATIADRNFNLDNMSWEDRYGKGYTGLGKTQEDIAKAWEDLHAASTAETQAPAPATTTPATTKPAAPTCDYETKEKDGWIYYRSTETGCDWEKKEKAITVPDGWIEFGGILGECKSYHDVATDTYVWAAFIDAGTSWKKLVKCEGGPDEYWSGNYRYVYNGGAGSGWHASLSGTTCTGYTNTEVVPGKVYQYTCNPNYGSYEFPWIYIRDVVVTPEPTETPTPTGPPEE